MKSGSLDWSPALADDAAALADSADAAGFTSADILTALEDAARGRYRHFLRGVRQYREATWRRDQADEDHGLPPVVWQAGSARLYDFGLDPSGDRQPPVLLVPSLVNRSYVLDLMRGRSLVRDLAGRGLRPLLLDWGSPADERSERRFTLDDYVSQRLLPAFDTAQALADGGPVPVVGYCMGGLLALACAQQRPEAVSGLGLLATPWDFHAEREAEARALAALAATWLPGFAVAGMFPVDALQTLFALNDPLLALRKFTAFARLDPESDAARHFMALEDWLNDGIPLALEVAATCFLDWYGRNTTVSGEWQVLGEPVRPAELTMPAAAFLPTGDRIVPPGSAAALAEALPNAMTVSVPAGHIGMVTGSRGQTGLWQPLTRWLHQVTGIDE